MPQIVAFTGLRRVGKTTLMRKIVEDYIKNNFGNKKILYFSFDEYKEEKIVSVIKEYEDISARAKIMYARKEELSDLLKIKLIGQDRLTAGGHNYSLGKTTVTNFTDIPQVINLLADAAGVDYRQVLRQIGSIAKGKFEELLSSLKTVLPASEYFRLENQLEQLTEQDYQPRLQSTVVRKN